jgi:hypothetical protein
MDVIKDGKCGFVCSAFGGGEQSIHMRKSMSWQDFVRRDGAVFDSFLQFPLS